MNAETLGKKSSHHNLIIIATILLTVSGAANESVADSYAPLNPAQPPKITATCTPVTGTDAADLVFTGSPLSVSASCTATTTDGTVEDTTKNCEVDDPINPIKTSWTATGCGATPASGNGTTASFKVNTIGQVTVTFTVSGPDLTGTTYSASPNPKVTFNVVQLTSATVWTANAPNTRTTIGDGETVNLTLSPAPSGTITWKVTAPTTGGGSVSPSSGGTSGATFTAPGQANGQLNCTVTATETDSSGTSSWAITFTVIDPTGFIEAIMDVDGNKFVRHNHNRPDIGFGAFCFIAPDYVNFGAVSCEEEQAAPVASGVYIKQNGVNHETQPVPNPATTTVLAKYGTELSIGDKAYSGDDPETFPTPPFHRAR
jgi:hypothetical protein